MGGSPVKKHRAGHENGCAAHGYRPRTGLALPHARSGRGDGSLRAGTFHGAGPNCATWLSILTENLNLRISTHTLPTNPARLVLQCAEVAAVELRAVGVVAGGAAARQAGGEQEVGCTPCADGRENI